MINVALKDPPSTYDATVAVPGAAHLKSNPATPPVPTAYWTNRSYWGAIKRELWELYGGICCYSCTYIEPSNAYWGTVEHFLPKSLYPQRAYDWANFRLASTVPNAAKGNHEDVLDPFAVQDGWFEISESTLKVEVGSDAPPEHASVIDNSINRLKLNRTEHLTTRKRYVRMFLEGNLTLAGLHEEAPFLAREVTRWGIQPAS